jgi:hypothetical protein
MSGMMRTTSSDLDPVPIEKEIQDGDKLDIASGIEVLPRQAIRLGTSRSIYREMVAFSL